MELEWEQKNQLGVGWDHWELEGVRATVAVWNMQGKSDYWYYVSKHPDFPNNQGKLAATEEEAKALAVAYYRMNQ